MLRMHFTGDTSDVMPGLLRFAERLNYRIEEGGIPVSLLAGGDCLEIRGDAAGYQIGFGSKTECFRGLAILIDAIKAGKQEIAVSEKAHFETCGAMVDVSNDPVLRVETVRISSNGWH